MKIINRIFFELDKQNLKSSDLANFLGINKSVISNWKSRTTNPPAEFIVPICEFLNVDVIYLLTGETINSFENVSNNLFSELENNIIQMFRALDDRDKEDIFELIKLKYKRTLKDI